jgi:ketosteroid isomerase-like protein
MTQPTFPTAQDAENAFYEALEKGDLEAMMAVWAEDEEIICVHPGGARLAGHAQVRESWRRLFSGGGSRIHVTRRIATQAMMVTVHSVHETSPTPGGKRDAVTVAATNVYLRTASGWRMILHHASLGPATQDIERTEKPPKLLH